VKMTWGDNDSDTDSGSDSIAHESVPISPNFIPIEEETHLLM